MLQGASRVHVGKVDCNHAGGVQIGSKEIVSTSRVQSASTLQMSLAALALVLVLGRDGRAGRAGRDLIQYTSLYYM